MSVHVCVYVYLVDGEIRHNRLNTCVCVRACMSWYVCVAGSLHEPAASFHTSPRIRQQPPTHLASTYHLEPPHRGGAAAHHVMNLSSQLYSPPDNSRNLSPPSIHMMNLSSQHYSPSHGPQHHLPLQSPSGHVSMLASQIWSPEKSPIVGSSADPLAIAGAKPGGAVGGAKLASHMVRENENHVRPEKPVRSLVWCGGICICMLSCSDLLAQAGQCLVWQAEIRYCSYTRVGRVGVRMYACANVHMYVRARELLDVCELKYACCMQASTGEPKTNFELGFGRGSREQKTNDDQEVLYGSGSSYQVCRLKSDLTSKEVSAECVVLSLVCVVVFDFMTRCRVLYRKPVRTAATQRRRDRPWPPRKLLP
jgi:hypothetical protein